MKTFFTFLIFLAFSLGVNAQLTEIINFETGINPDSIWVVFANGPGASDEDINVVANPDKNEVNQSDSVLQFIVHANSDPWLGMFNDYLAAPMLFTADKHTLTMMVYKSIESRVMLKVEVSPDGGSAIEVGIDNSLVDEWELLTFDMSTHASYKENVSYERLTVFPDFPEKRTDSAIVFLDNITSPGVVNINQISHRNIKIYPNPTTEVLFVQHPEMNGFTIFNLLGKTVKTNKFEKVNSTFIDVSDLMTGVYFLSVDSGSGVYSIKFMKN